MPMRSRRTSLKLICVALIVADATAIIGWRFYVENSPRQQARILFRELVAAGWSSYNTPQIPVELQDRLEKLGLWDRARPRQEALIIKDILGLGRPAVPVLIEGLASSTSWGRLGAAQALVRLNRLCGPLTEAVPALARALGDVSRDVRVVAANALGEIGPAAEAAAPALIRTLGNRSERMRQSADLALRRIGLVAVPHLAKALSDEDEDIRYGACQVLSGCYEDADPVELKFRRAFQRRTAPEWARAVLLPGPADEQSAAELVEALGAAVPALRRALKDESARVRVAAANILTKAGMRAKQSVPELAHALRDPDPSVRLAAAKALAGLGPAARPAVPELTMALKDEDWRVRAAAAAVFKETGVTTAEALRILLDMLKDENGKAQSSAGQAVHHIDMDGQEATSVLLGALKDRSLKEEWARLIQVIGGLGPDARAAAPTLVKFLAHGTHDEKMRTHVALMNIRPPADEIMPALIEALKSPQPDVREDIIEIFVRMGGDAKAAIPALVAALKDDSLRIRSAAKQALRSVCDKARKEAAPILTEAMKDESWRIRKTAITILAQLRQDANIAVPAMLMALKDTNEEVVTAARSAIGAIAPARREDVPALIKALGDETPDIRYAAVDLAGRTGVVAIDALPALMAAWRMEDEDSQQLVLWAVRSISGGAPKKVVPILVGALKNDTPRVRMIAVQMLRNHSGSPTVIPALKEALKDEDARVRSLARTILRDIERRRF